MNENFTWNPSVNVGIAGETDDASLFVGITYRF
jgi:hypothetical protein